MSDLRLDVLGGFSLRANDRVLLDESWPRRKAKAILEILAISPGHRVHRERLVDLVWPELPPDRALDQLYKALHFIRSATAPAGSGQIVVAERERIELAAGVDVDVDWFRRLAREARSSGDPGDIATALEAYTDDLLPDDPFEDWAQPVREELRALRRELRSIQLRAYEERNDVERAVNVARSIIETDPADEAAHLALLRLLVRAGDRTEAIRAYHRCRDALRRELDLEPSEETEAQYRLLLEAGVATEATRRVGDAAVGAGGPRDGMAEPLLLLEELGDVTRRTGDAERSVLLYEQALADVERVGDGQAVVRLRGKAALASIQSGDLSAAGHHLDLARKACATIMPEPYSAPLLHYLLAQLRWQGGRYEDALLAAEQAATAARTDGDARREAEACEVLALSCHALGDWRRGIEAELRRQQLAVDDGFSVELALEGHVCLWEYHLYGDRPYAAVEDTVQAALTRAEAMGNVQAMAVCVHALGALHFVTGRWDEADDELRRGIRLARSVGAELATIVGLQRLACLETARGHLEAALRDLEEALRLVGVAKHPPTPRHTRTRVLAALARNRLQAGAIDEARAYVERARTAQGEFGRCLTCDALLNPVAVEVALAAGDVEAARSAADEAALTATAFGGDAWLATADLAGAMVLAASGSVAVAERTVRRAIDRFERLGQPYDLARSLALLAELQSRRDNGRSGASASDAGLRARDLFGRLGAEPSPRLPAAHPVAADTLA